MQPIADWGSALLTSITTALALLLSFIPKLIGFLVIILIGWLVASALSRGVTYLLRRIGFDRFADRAGITAFSQRMNVSLDPAAILGKVVYWFIFLIFLVPAVESFGLTSVNNLLTSLIDYIPNVFVALLILFLGVLLSNFVADLVRGATASSRIGNPNVFAAIARYTIIAFAAVMALEQLQIAPSLLNLLVAAIVFGAALAFGLAFGLGGRDAAQRLIERGESSLYARSQNSIQQNMNRSTSAIPSSVQQVESLPSQRGRVGSPTIQTNAQTIAQQLPPDQRPY